MPTITSGSVAGTAWISDSASTLTVTYSYPSDGTWAGTQAWYPNIPQGQPALPKKPEVVPVKPEPGGGRKLVKLDE